MLKKKLFLVIAGILFGGIGGYIYYLKVGCVSGTCPITSNPYISALWGAFVGYLLFDMFNFKSKKKKRKSIIS